MSKTFTVKVLEQCKVAPPPNTTPPTSLIPLTFFDLPWLFFSPSQPLFFYHLPYSNSHFKTITIPALKHSLSLTLQHYYPFAATLFLPSAESNKPHLVFTSDDSSVSLTIALSNDGDFEYLCNNHPREVNDFHLLVPKLVGPNLSFIRGNKEVPLLAIQITTFPNVGICIGLAFHHVVADGRTFSNFFKTWASYCSLLGTSSPLFPLESLPFYDRSVIVDAKGHEEIFLKEWRRTLVHGNNVSMQRENKVDLSNSTMVRATFLMGPTEMEKVKSLIIDCCNEKNKAMPVHVSAYVLTCALLWVCLVKTQQSMNRKMGDEDPIYFGFIAGGITRLDFEVPMSYLGNCVGFGRASLRRRDLIGEEGVIVAAKAIGSTIKKLDESILGKAEKWVLEWRVLHGSEQHVHATWSPKLKLYECDFGWGKPKKIEEISIDSTRAVSLLQSRDVEGGIEIGLALPKKQMEAFTILFNQTLNSLP